MSKDKKIEEVYEMVDLYLNPFTKASFFVDKLLDVLQFEQERKETEYQKFFRKKMKQWGIKSPKELDDKKKKEFFKEVEKEWTKEKKGA